AVWVAQVPPAAGPSHGHRLQPEVLTSSNAGVGHRSKASRTPSQSASPEHPPNAGAAAARVRAPTMTRHQADRLLKRVMIYFLSAEGPSSVASANAPVTARASPGRERPASRR